MNNSRFILFFLVGILFLGGAMVFLSWRARVIATADTRTVLCTFRTEEVETVDMQVNGTNALSLTRTPSGTWRLVRPFNAPADAEPVAQLLDLLTVQPIGDMRSERELADMDEHVADFGLARPGLVVDLVSGARREHVFFGSCTASGSEVYARVEGLQNVFTVPAKAVSALPKGPDAFRVRSVLTCLPEEIVGMELRLPGKPLVKLVRESTSWRLEAPVPGPADKTAVAVLVNQLTTARVAAFELPSASRPKVSPEGIVSVADLAPYGLAADVGLSLTVRSVDGAFDQIVFGGAAGADHVWSLVHNGSAVVKLPSALADLCRASVAALRDTRVFPLADGEKVMSLSVTAGSLVYVLARDSEGVWRLESPVVAPADQTAAVSLAERVLRLKQDELPAEDAVRQGKELFHVSVVTSRRGLPGVAVPGNLFGPREALADLRSKTLLLLDPATVRRLSVKRAEDGETAVRWDSERTVWNLDRGTSGTAPARSVNKEAVKRLLAALTRVEAESVEAVAATADDLRRCGLVEPEVVIAVDMDAADAVRRNVLLGGVAPGGGRYATTGGADAVFIVSKRVAAELNAVLAE